MERSTWEKPNDLNARPLAWPEFLHNLRMGGAYARLCRRDDREHRLPGCTACRQPGSSHRRPARVRRDDPGCAGPGDGSVTGDRLQHRPRAAGRRPRRRCPRQCRPSGSASPLLKSAPPRTPAARRPPRHARPVRPARPGLGRQRSSAMLTVLMSLPISGPGRLRRTHDCIHRGRPPPVGSAAGAMRSQCRPEPRTPSYHPMEDS